MVASARGSDLISRVVLCYRLCSLCISLASSGAGRRLLGRGGYNLGKLHLASVLPGGRGSIYLLGAEGTAVLKSGYRTAATKPERILRLAHPASLNLYFRQRCRVLFILEQETFLFQSTVVVIFFS